MADKWKIKSGHVHGGKDAVDLVGCFINKNAAGTAYQFNSADPNSSVLSTTPGTSLPSVPFSFPQYGPWPGTDGYYWTITVTSLTSGANNNDASGSWTNTDLSVENETGTFTAQSEGVVDDQADAASASA